MKVEFSIDNDNESFKPIHIASAIIENIDNCPNMPDADKLIFLRAISEHIKVYCDYSFKCSDSV